MNEQKAQGIFIESLKFAKNFMVLPSNASIILENYSKEQFGSEEIAAVTHDEIVIFNRSWIEKGEENNPDDVRYFCFHDLRHVYQHDQIHRLDNNEKTAEPVETVKLWKYEFEHYITNLGDRLSYFKNIYQEIEQDANGYAYGLLNIFHLGEQGSGFRIRWPDEVNAMANERSKKYYDSKPEFKRYIDRKKREFSGINPVGKRPERNDKCPCGSGKKLKQCCLGNGIYD